MAQAYTPIPLRGLDTRGGVLLSFDKTNLVRQYPLAAGQYTRAYDGTRSGTLASHTPLRSVTTISGTDKHHFDPVHTDRIEEVNLSIDGATRTYVAYDSNVGGDEIRLYYTDSLGDTWSDYSSNPILGPETTRYRWPSTTIDDSGTLHMFLNNRNNNEIERWTSTDGINFTQQEVVLTGPTQYNNPEIWQNPNDGDWYLYWKGSSDGTSSGDPIINVRSASTLSGLSSASDTDVGVGPYSTFGAPTASYMDGKYWLYAETDNDDGEWIVLVWSSDQPDGGFTECTNSPVLPKNSKEAAVPVHRLAPDGSTAYLYYNVYDGSSWTQETRETPLGTAVAGTPGYLASGASYTYDSSAGKYVVDYDGASGYVEFPPPAQFSAYTLIVVSECRSVSGGSVNTDLSMTENNGVLMRYEGDGTYQFYHRDGSAYTNVAGESVSNDTPNMWAMTYDGSTVEAYKNTTSLGSASAGYSSPNSGNHALGATAPSADSEHLDGKQHYALFADTAFSSSQLERIHAKLLE